VVAQFLGVLKPEIADIVSIQPYWTYTDVGRLALKVEKHIKAKNKGSTSHFTPPTRNAYPIAPKTAPKVTTPTTSITEPKLDEPGDELVYPDHGEALVIQRVINKMSISEPAPPARDPHDVETIKRLQQWIQELKLQQLRLDSPAEEVKTKPNVWDDEPVDVNPFGRENLRYVNRLYQPRRKDHVVDRDDRYCNDPIRNLELKIKIPKLTEDDVEEFINEFDKLRMRSDIVEEEEHVVACFLGVLKPEIADIHLKHHLKPPPLQPRLQVPDNAGLIYDTDAEPELDEPGDVLFSIGKCYKDEVWCEVIPMDAAQFLLGSPWQFDRKTKHNGFQNTYRFKKDGRRAIDANVVNERINMTNTLGAYFVATNFCGRLG
nr:reverse transcriptase domain-containing protein [Tanacetum cinerariifolium]